MSFQKAEELLRLAILMAGQRTGITIQDVVDEFGGTWRTAQRRLRAVENVFDQVEAVDDEERKRRWRLPRSGLGDLLSVGAEELTSLDLAIEALHQTGNPVDAQRVSRLKARVRALVPAKQALRLEPDHEALLEAQGIAFRPGPRPRSNAQVEEAVGQAIKAGTCIEMLYHSRNQKRSKWETLGPLGILVGARRYLVALRPGDDSSRARLYRFEAIKKARTSKEVFVRPGDFDMREFSLRSFGTYQSEVEYGEVVWRFTAEAAGHAASYVFHPNQTMKKQKDGSLIVRFVASGHLEMCWHLYAWGDKVEVIAPEALRKLCSEHRRSDFPAFP